MAMHLLEGLFLGMRNSQQIVGQRQQLLALGALSAGTDARAQQPGGRSGPGDRRAARAGRRHAAQAGDARRTTSSPPKLLELLVDVQEEAVKRRGHGAAAVGR